MPGIAPTTWQARAATFVTTVYTLLLSYLLLTPEPLSLFFGSAAGEIHGAVDGTVSTYMQHTLSYAVLMGLLVWTASARGRSSILVCVGLAGSHAVLTEGLQRFVPGRHGDLWDLAADFAGMAIVLASAGMATALQRVLVQESLRAESAGPEA
ncbi:MAG: VanZ family protein [Planctomycetaceae bacterium]